MPWAKQEDTNLLQLVNQTGLQQITWKKIAEKLRSSTGIHRTDKQCRDRYHSKLKPELNDKRQWTEEEQYHLFWMNLIAGNQWAIIAKQLPGRSDNSVKNYFHQSMKKALKRVNDHIKRNRGEFSKRRAINDSILGKILKVCGPKGDHLENVTANELSSFAWDIKRSLIEIAKSKDEEIEEEMLTKTAKKLISFIDRCHSPKSAKNQEQEMSSLLKLPTNSDLPIQKQQDGQKKEVEQMDQSKNKAEDSRELRLKMLIEENINTEEKISANLECENLILMSLMIGDEYALDMALRHDILIKGYREDSDQISISNPLL